MISPASRPAEQCEFTDGRSAERVAAEKVSVEVIDLRCVMPLDESTIITSAARTGRVLVLDEAPRGGGLAAEVLALVAETATARAARVLLHRLTGAPTPIGYAPHLAAAAVPDARAAGGFAPKTQQNGLQGNIRGNAR